MHAESGKEPPFVAQINRLGVGFNEALHAQSLAFLHALWHKAVFPFDQWLTKMERRAIQLRAHQFDRVIAMLQMEIALPEGIMDSLHDYLMASPDAESMIQPLLALHASELNEPAYEHHLIHHALPHALEIAHRVNQVIENLGLLTAKDPATRFLRAVATLMMQFHDHEQKNKGEYPSVEEATAARVSGWIKTELSISAQSELRQLIDFMADRIIVLGTTRMDSATRTMDLSELYFDVRDLAASAGYPVVYTLPADRSVVPETKAGFIYSIDTILLLTGVCDKNPASIYDVVVAQAADPMTSTLSIMSRYFQRPLLMVQFFESNDFFSPFEHGASDLASQQAFLMALIAHVCQRAELSGSSSHPFIAFVQLCRKERLMHESPAAFMQAFHAQCTALDMARILGLFFFSAIDAEMNVCLSQERGLVFVVNKLISMGFSPKSMAGIASGHFQPLITPRAPVRDAANLRAIQLFYAQLDPPSKEWFISELVFAIVVQAGELLAVNGGVVCEKKSLARSAVTIEKSECVPMVMASSLPYKIGQPRTLRESFERSRLMGLICTRNRHPSACTSVFTLRN
ncbi:MAG TPA: hypothetical protein DDY37_06740 [Legionella sp.]|nr:hypothetical protein [Legionella sp.]